jgi:hypothetical protein
MGQADVPVLGRQGEPFGEEGTGCLEAGEVFETTDAIAGEAPHWRPATDADNLAHFETRVAPGEPADTKDEDGEPIPGPAVTEVLDLGSGLLAQADNYVEVETADPTKGLNVDQLKAYADQHGIDLGDATLKADIAAAIRKAV